MESQDTAEVVPLFGDREVPHAVHVDWGARRMAPSDKMRLLHILFGAEGDEVDASAA